MTIANTVKDFLNQKGIAYTVIQHPHSAASSMETAASAHITGEQIAKGVVLKTANDYVLAVLPATHTLELETLGRQLDRPLDLATEPELHNLFPDCELGAVPALGPAYGLETIVDESLKRRPEIYFEAGDHEELIHISEKHFEALLAGVKYSRFSHHKP